MGEQHTTGRNRTVAMAMAGLVGAAAIMTGCGSEATTGNAGTEDTTVIEENAMSTNESNDSSTAATEIDAAQSEAEIASENTTPIAITVTAVNDNRYIEDYKVYVEAAYPSFSCKEENYNTLGDALTDLSKSIADKAKAEIDAVEEYARTDAENGILEEYGSYAYEQSASLIRADSSVVSILVTTYVNQGGAHPSTTYTTYNYDPQAGMTFELDEIIQDDQYDSLATTIATSLANTYDHNLFNCYMELESAATDGAEIDNDAFIAALAEDVQAMIDEGTLAYTIGQTGITFYFEPYALAVYAAGSQVITINYADAPDLVWEGYTHAPARYISAITPGSNYMENADGRLVSLTVDAISEGEYSFAYDLTIRLDGEALTDTLPSYAVNSYLIHVDGRNYLYVEAVQENDWETTYVYDLNGSAPTAVESLERWFATSSPSDPDNMELETITHLFSTNVIHRSYRVGDDGMPVAQTDYDLVGYTVSQTITTLQDITAPVRDTYEGASTEETISAGTTLTPYATDGESWIDLQLEDGRYVRLEVTNDWPQTYQGTDVQELFDGLIYAG